MSGIDLTSADAFLQAQFRKGAIKDLTHTDNPAYSMMYSMKGDKWGGDGTYTWSIKGGVGQAGGSAVFAHAVTGRATVGGAPNGLKLTLTQPRKNYQLAQVDGMTMELLKKKETRFYDILGEKVSDATKAMAQNFEFCLFNDASAVRARISSGGGTNTVTITDPTQAISLERGMVLVAASTSTATTPRQTGGVDDSARISNINRTTGVITLVTVSGGGASTWSNSDYLFRRGDLNNIIYGFRSYIPDSDPSVGESFAGTDRSVDVERFAGHRVGTAGTPLASLKKGAMTIGKFGGRPDVAFVSYTDWLNIANELDYRVSTHEMPHGTGQAGYSALKIATVPGIVNIIPARECPEGRALMLQRDTWELIYAGDDVIFVDEGTKSARLLEDDDAYEWRVKSYSQVICTAPGYNANIVL